VEKPALSLVLLLGLTFPKYFTASPMDVAVFTFRWNRALFITPKFGCLSNFRYCADRAQYLSGPAPTMYSECSRFHPNRFTFGGVIAERVSNAKFPVNPIFDRSLASSRIMNAQTNCVVGW